MKSFETKIVKTWEPSWLLRIIGIICIIGGGAILYIFEVETRWVKIIGYTTYIIGMFLALSRSFIRPKDLGIIAISAEMIKVDFKGTESVFFVSDLRKLGFNYRGYAGFWKHSFYGNKNHLYFRNEAGKEYDYELVIQNKEKKEELKRFLKEIKATSNLKVEQKGLYSF